MITIGEITGVHGVKGYVKIRSFAESSDIFATGIPFFLNSTDKEGKWYNIISATPHKKGIIILFEGVTRDIAETLVGKSISVSKDALPELEDDTYYWEDLTGLRVVDINWGYLGVIDHIISTGSNDVFVVKSSNTSKQIGKALQNKEILIPALSWIVLSVDLDNFTMTVDLPEGLKE
ncbi:MAG: 16S rRNA processing protein RimM [Desulfamplus sp.]|nr:16S rRNA processing protein RimM [Desulfamplus sp.]